MGSSQKIVSGVAWGGILNILNAVYGFISVPILISYFGKGEYGLIGLATSVNIYVQLLDMGMNITGVRFFSNYIAKKDYSKLNQLFNNNLAFYGIIGLINAIILLLVAFFSDSIFNVTPQQDIIIKKLFYILAAMSIVNWYTSSFTQMINATENVAWGTRLNIIPKIWMLVVLFITVYCELSITTYFVLTYCALFVTIPLLVRKLKAEIPRISFLPKFNKQIFKEILPYSLNTFSFGFFQFSFYNLRPILLGIQATPEDVAEFQILSGLTGVSTMLVTPVISSLLPSSTRVVANDNKDAYYRLAYTGTKYITILLAFCIFGVMCISSELLELYVGKSYLHLCVWLNFWLLLLLGNHNQGISSLVLAQNDISAVAKISMFSSVLGLISAYLLIPHFKVGGVVIAFAFYTLSQTLFYYIYYWPKVMSIDSKRVFLRSFAPYVLVGLILFAIINTLLENRMPLIITIIVKGLIFAVFYSIISYLLLQKPEKDLLHSLFVSLKRKII